MIENCLELIDQYKQKLLLDAHCCFTEKDVCIMCSLETNSIKGRYQNLTLKSDMNKGSF